MKPTSNKTCFFTDYFDSQESSNTLGNQLCYEAQALGFGDFYMRFDKPSGLLSVIAVHSLQRGPAIGGCRLKPYLSIEAAIEDAMRLAKMMSYKAALIDLPHGGAKAVIVEPKEYSRAALLKAYAGFVDSLGGRYITAVDSGTTPEDMDAIAKLTPHVLCTSPTEKADKGASFYTAVGVFKGIEAAVKFKHQRDTTKGVRVVIQGAGSVGYFLAEKLVEGGAVVTMADVNAEHLAHCVKDLGVNTIAPEAVYSAECDVFSPCALGGVLNASTIPQLKAAIVAGSANNQLAGDQDAELLHERGILYAPDFLINAGGLLYAAAMYRKAARSTVRQGVDSIYERLFTVFKRAQSENCSPHFIVSTIAEEKLNTPVAPNQ